MKTYLPLLGFIVLLNSCSQPNPITLDFLPPNASQAVVKSLTGSVFVLRSEKWIPLEAGSLIGAPDIIRVTEGAECEVQIGLKITVLIGSNSLVSWPELRNDPDKILLKTDLIAGSMAINSVGITQKDSISLTAGNTRVMIKESQFSASKKGETTRVNLKTGDLQILSPQGDLALSQSGGALIQEGQTPVAVAYGKSDEVLVQRMESTEITDWSQVKVVKFTLKTNPVDAQIFFSGRMLARGIYSSLIKVGSSMAYTISKPGFSSKSITVNSQVNEIIQVDLDPAPLDSGVGEIPPAEDSLITLESELTKERTRLQELDKERFDLAGRLEEAATQTKNLEILLDKSKKDRLTLEEEMKKSEIQRKAQVDALNDNLRRSEAQRKNLSEALSAKMKELQQTLDDNQ